MIYGWASPVHSLWDAPMADVGLYRRTQPLRSSGEPRWADRARHRRAHDEFDLRRDRVRGPDAAPERPTLHPGLRSVGLCAGRVIGVARKAGSRAALREVRPSTGRLLSGTNPPAPIATRYQVIVDPARRGARRTYLGGIDHGGGGDSIAPALTPKAIKMETFPLRAGAYDERLTRTERVSVLRARLTARLAVHGASIAPLRLGEPQSTPLSG